MLLNNPATIGLFFFILSQNKLFILVYFNSN